MNPAFEKLLRKLEKGKQVKTPHGTYAVLYDGLVYVHTSAENICQKGTSLTIDSFREYYLPLGIRVYNDKSASNECIIYPPKNTSKKIQAMKNMTGREIYETFGMKRNEKITVTAAFAGEYEMDVEFIIPDNDDEYPWAQAVLFHKGCKCCCSDVDDEFFKEWTLSDDDITFKTIVKPVDYEN